MSILLKRAMTGGFIFGCNIKGRDGAALTITHLLYADDTIIFCEAKEEQLLHLSWILLWFEACLGLKINLNKSELIPVGAVENMDALAAELGTFQPLIWAYPWEPPTSLWLPGTTSRRKCTRNWPFGKEILSQKEGGSP